ncbi:MAG: hypothetical protein AAGA01_13910 [Cyanobacteria bacterium P01_E01_bin.43]
MAKQWGSDRFLWGDTPHYSFLIFPKSTLTSEQMPDFRQNL